MPLKPYVPDPRLNMRSLSVLVMEGSPHEQDIVAQVLSGFGVGTILRPETVDAAKDMLRRERIDLAMFGAALPGTDGYDVIRWLRREQSMPNRSVPTILLSAHTRMADVRRARDCGASWVLAKPVTSGVLYKGISWLAKDQRPFVECAVYTGPDRRFRQLGPPPGSNGRRSTDLSLEVGDATSDNMSQADIDALLNPKGSAPCVL